MNRSRLPFVRFSLCLCFGLGASGAAQEAWTGQVVDPFLVGPEWTVEGTQPEAEFGGTLAYAGDVNGDGYDDVLIGASHFQTTTHGTGRVWLYYGGAHGLEREPAWSFASDQPGAELGHALAGGGDVNGDGFDDVIVAAPFQDLVQPGSRRRLSPGNPGTDTDAGTLFIFHGSAKGLAEQPDGRIDGAAGEHLGLSVADARDVNADGFDDLVARGGTPGFDSAGFVRLYLGSAEGLKSIPAHELTGAQEDSEFGRALCGVGDVNGDGFDDIVIGEPAYDSDTRVDAGRAVLHTGNADGVAAAIGWSWRGFSAGARFGRHLAAADFNGDGYADFVVASPNTNTRTFGGSPFGPSEQWLHERRPHALAAGDVDGDGFGEVVYGLPNATSRDEIWVLRGSPTGTQEAPAFEDEVRQPRADFGRAVLFAGDVNGDGLGDVLAGAPDWNSEEANDVGRVTLYLGKLDPILPPTPAWRVNLPDAKGLGWYLALADVNGDRLADVIAADLGPLGEGRIQVFHSAPNGPGQTPDWSAVGPHPGAGFGTGVNSAGDVNGDGFEDIILGADEYEGPSGELGLVVVYHGSPHGLLDEPSWEIRSDTFRPTGRQSGVGDVNRDGFDDVIVAFYGAASGEPGQARVYLGSAAGLATTPVWVSAIEHPTDAYATDVAGAGDVNNDGFEDVIVGGTHSLQLFYGTPTGPTLEPVWSFRRNNSFMGVIISGVGDVNGDGHADFAGNHCILFLGSPTLPGDEPDNQPLNHTILGVARGGDLDGDGYDDVLGWNQGYDNDQNGEGQVLVFRGSPEGILERAAWRWESNESSNPIKEVVGGGDIDGDGRDDLITGALETLGTGAVYWFKPLPVQ